MPAGPVLPREFRKRLAADVAEDYEAIRSSLRAALDAEQTKWGTCECGKRVPVEVADFTARVRAIETYISHGYGRAVQPVEQVTGSERIAAETDAYREMSSDDKRAYRVALALKLLEHEAARMRMPHYVQDKTPISDDVRADAAKAIRTALRVDAATVRRAQKLRAERFH